VRDLAEKLSVLVEARPIQIDKSGAKNVAKKMVAGLAAAIQGMNPEKMLGKGGPIGPVQHVDVKNVLGHKQRVYIALSSVEGGAGQWVSGGGLGTYKGSGKMKGQPIIVVVLNGGNTVASFLSAMTYIENAIYGVLIHELTHAADVGREAKMPRNSPKVWGGLDVGAYESYVNEPTEVRAYMQEVVDQALGFVSQSISQLRKIASPNKIVLWAVQHSETWGVIEGSLNPKNRKLIMKAVYTALQDAGFVGKP